MSNDGDRVTMGPQRDVAFVGAHLIDGTGSPPLRHSAVVVSGGQITWVGSASDLDPTRNLQLIDVGGRYLIPGLMDANVHLVYHPEPEILLRYELGCYDDLVLEAAQVALRAGITTVFDTWGPLESLRRVRDRINADEVVGSRIFLAGNIIGNDGPWSADFGSPYSEHLNSAVVDSINQHWEQGVGGRLTWMPADEVRRAVRDYIATSGIDFVKYASSAHGPLRFIALSPDAQRAIVEEAHAARFTVQACTLTPEALKLAIEAGVDLLQHGDVTGRYPMPRETVELIAARQLPCVALLATERHISAVMQATENPVGALWRDDLSVAVKDENDRNLIRAGAKLMLATDGGIFSPTANTSRWIGPLYAGLPDVPRHLGSSHILWLQAAIERGMAPMEALLAATRNIAQGYGKSDELGTIEVGKRADLVVLDTNPLDDPAHYARIVQVVKDGRVVDRQRLPERRLLTRDA